MAEIVELQMERSILDYEQMRTFKIFDEDEIKDIIKKREHFEYLLVQQQKDMKNYLKYIKYERELVTLTMERKRHESSKILEQSIISRIKNLYVQATNRFYDVERLWTEYFMFCTKAKFDLSEIRIVLTKMRQFHGDKPLVWIKCIKWERSVNTDVSEVKTLLLQAIQRHPTCIKLYVELLNLQLTNENKADTNQVIQQSIVVFKNGHNQIPTIEFCNAMLNETMKFDYAKEMCTSILQSMKEKHLMEPLFWHTIAQRELAGLRTYKEPHQESGKLTLKAKIELCVQVYESAVSEIDTIEMWNYYLDAMLLLNRDTAALGSFKRRMLGTAYKQAEEANRLSINHYLQYIEIMYATKTDDEIILKSIKKAVALYPSSQEIWKMYMKYYIKIDDANKVKEVFNESKKKLASDGVALWHLYISYLKTTSTAYAEVDRVFKQVILQPHENFDDLKAAYMEWAYAMGGINYVRTIYRVTCKSALPCLKMHKKMAEYESELTEPDLKAWRNCLELGTTKYGVDQTEVWLSLINFELKYGEPKNVSKITAQAKRTLRNDLVSSFTAEREFLQMGMVELR